MSTGNSWMVKMVNHQRGGWSWNLGHLTACWMILSAFFTLHAQKRRIFLSFTPFSHCLCAEIATLPLPGRNLLLPLFSATSISFRRFAGCSHVNLAAYRAVFAIYSQISLSMRRSGYLWASGQNYDIVVRSSEESGVLSLETLLCVHHFSCAWAEMAVFLLPVRYLIILGPTVVFSGVDISIDIFAIWSHF